MKPADLDSTGKMIQVRELNSKAGIDKIIRFISF